MKKYGAQTVPLRRSSYVAFDTEFGGFEKVNSTVADYVASWPEYRAQWAEQFGAVMGGEQPVPAASAKVSDASAGDSGRIPHSSSASTVDPLYLFGALEALPGLRQQYEEPAMFHRFDSGMDEEGKGVAQPVFAHNSSARDAIALFFLCPALSGVSLHQHTNAWNGLVYGRKRWFLLPPYALWGPTGMPMLSWVRDFYPQLAPHVHECIQEAGEVLYVPSDWYHGVLNVKDSVGVVVEVGHTVQLLDKLLEEEAIGSGSGNGGGGGG